MKILLLLFVIGICALGLRTPEVMQAVGVAGAAQDPAKVTAATMSETQTAQRPMSANEFAERSKSDPDAYRKYLDSHQVQERTEIDKLLNFFTRGEYE